MSLSVQKDKDEILLFIFQHYQFFQSLIGVFSGAVKEIDIVSAVSNKTAREDGPENTIDRDFNTMYFPRDDPVTGIRGNFLFLTLAKECRVSDVKIYSTTDQCCGQQSNIINTTIYAIGKSWEFKYGSIDGQFLLFSLNLKIYFKG